MSASAIRHRAAAAALVLTSAACSGSSGKAANDSMAVETVAVVVPGPAVPDTAQPAPSATPPSVSPTPRDTTPPRGVGAVPRPAPTPLPVEDVMVGEVVAGGTANAPLTSLRVEGRGPVVLVGPLESELRRLGGATVTVAGAPVGSPPNGFSVTRYDIVSVDGQRPLVGELLSRDGGLALASTDTVRLASVPAALRDKVGARVWIVGRRTGDELTVQSFGVLRDPQR